MGREKKIMIFCLLLAGVFRPVFTEEWKAYVVKKLDALVSSCVVFPCTFTTPKDLPSAKLRGIWHVENKKEDRIYYEDRTRVLENYRGRTELLGRLGDNNCTLEMTGIKDHDNGPFCFRIEHAEKDQPTTEMFSFVEDCVELKMLPDPPKPTLIHSQMATEGAPYSITCSVFHTCPSHAPKLTWSRRNSDEVVQHLREIYPGNWESMSILAFIPEDSEDLTCTAEFNGGKTSSATLKLNVKRKVSYNHIIIPCAVGIGIALIIGVFCTLLVRKYKNRIAELQNQEGSMWNRISRLSRRSDIFFSTATDAHLLTMTSGKEELKDLLSDDEELEMVEKEKLS